MKPKSKLFAILRKFRTPVIWRTHRNVTKKIVTPEKFLIFKLAQEQGHIICI